MSVRWGVLSTARINDKFLAGAARAPSADVVAVASRDAGRARAYADSYGIAGAHGSYEALLDDDGVDVVYISLPNGLHQEWTERALRAGKHVLCEKPLGRRVADVERAFDVADAEGRLLMEAFMWRHNPQTARIAALVDEGAVGALRLVRASFAHGSAADDDVRLSSELEGGALMDVGCYCVSAARLLAGEPDTFAARQVIGGDGVDVGFAGAMGFAGGVLADFDAGLRMVDRHDLEVVGDAGSLFVADPWHCRAPGIELRRGDRVEHIDIAPADSYERQAENFSLAIRGEAEPLLGRADATGQARAIERLYAAADA